MPRYDYAKMKKEMNVLVVDSREELPPGLWVGVAEAARLIGITKMAMRYRAMRGEYPLAKIKGSTMLIKVTDFLPKNPERVVSYDEPDEGETGLF